MTPYGITPVPSFAPGRSKGYSLALPYVRACTLNAPGSSRCGMTSRYGNNPAAIRSRRISKRSESLILRT